MNSAFPDVLGVPVLSSQRLGSPMGSGPAMRKVPRKTRRRVKSGGKPESSVSLSAFQHLSLSLYPLQSPVSDLSFSAF
jgi:hypothetical protein